MNNNLVRLGMAVVAAFYVVTAGLWAADYFPLQKYYAQREVRDALIDSKGVDAAFETNEYREAWAYEQLYVTTHGDILETEGKLALYRSLILWGTVAFGVGGGVIFFTRRPRAASRSGSPAD